MTEFEKARAEKSNKYNINSASFFDEGADWAHNYFMQKQAEDKFGSLWAGKYYDKVEELNASEKQNTELKQLADEMAGALDELMDLMDGVRMDGYCPDSLTNQPAKIALIKYKAFKEGENG